MSVDLSRLRLAGEDLPSGFSVVTEELGPASLTQVFAKRVLWGTSPAVWWDVAAARDEDSARAAFEALVVEHQRQRMSGLFRTRSPLEHPRDWFFWPDVGDAASVEAIEIGGKPGIWAAVCDRTVVMKLSTTGIDLRTSSKLLERQVGKWPADEEAAMRRSTRRSLVDVLPPLKMSEASETDFLEYRGTMLPSYEQLWDALERTQTRLASWSGWAGWCRGEAVTGHWKSVLNQWTEACRLGTHLMIACICAHLLFAKGVPRSTLVELRGYVGGPLAELYNVRDREGDMWDYEKQPAEFAARPLREQLMFFRAHLPRIVDEQLLPRLRVTAQERGLPFPG